MVFDGFRRRSDRQELSLLSLKPVIYAANVAEDDLSAGNDYVKVWAVQCARGSFHVFHVILRHFFIFFHLFS